jgi:thymidylate synthase ThyX
MKEHTGMQGTEYFTHHVEIERLNNAWLNARDGNIEIAKALSEAGATKQITNRLLEPFMWHTCICTGTEFENFFALRAHPDAEIHIQELAYKMLEAANASTPKVLKSYEWHIPFGDNLDMQKTKGFTNEEAGDWQLKVATARCARVSYLNFEGKDDYKEDIRLYERLLKSKHASPFEHVARCMSKEEYEGFRKVEIRNGEKIDEYGWCKNLKGFIQHRALLELETQIDGRVQKSTTK